MLYQRAACGSKRIEHDVYTGVPALCPSLLCRLELAPLLTETQPGQVPPRTGDSQFPKTGL